MKNKRFIIKMVIRAIAFIILTLIVSLLFENAIITNDVALGQMSNSDEAYLLMEYYKRIKTIVSVIYGCISAFIVGTTVYDIYKFIKKKGEN